MSEIIWAVSGLMLVVAARWLWTRAAGREPEVHVPGAQDPFVNRQTMLRYHAALRAQRR